jgi:hypothetical protein
VGTQKSLNFLGVAALAVSFGVMPAFAGDLYNDIPSTDYSGGPETTSLSTYVVGNSFGSLIDPGQSGTATTADVVLSNYNPANLNGVSLTFDLYAIGSASGVGATPSTVYDLSGATLVDSVTQSFNIPGFNTVNTGPAPDNGNPVCTSGGAVIGGENTCGQLFMADFNLQSGGDALTAGQNYVWTVAGMNAVQGLNVELNDWVGSDNTCTSANPICTAQNPQYDTNYSGGAGTAVGSTGWTNIGQGEVSFSNSPEPATLGLIGLGLLGIGVSIRKKSGKA